MFIVEDEGLDPETADALQHVQDGIVHKRKGIQQSNELMHAVQHEHLFLLVFVDDLTVLFSRRDSLDSHLQT